MAGKRRRGRGLLILAVVALVLVAVLWVGYWYAARTVALSGLERLTASRSGGETLACTDLSVGGFPLYLDLSCGRSTYASGNQAISAAIGGVSASAPLYRPGQVAAELGTPFVANVAGAGVALTANWTQANASLAVGLDGLKSVNVTIASLKADNAGNALVREISADAARVDLEPATGNSFAFAAIASNLAVTLTDGRAFLGVDAEARLTALDVGGGLGSNPARTLLAWARNGGAVQIDKVRVSAAGALLILSGKLSISTDGLLNGSVVIQYNDINKLADLIETIRPGTVARHTDALEKLNSVTATVDSEDGPLHQTAVSFIEGSIWLGIIPLPVDPLPPIRF